MSAGASLQLQYFVMMLFCHTLYLDCTLIVPCAIWISLISDILIYCAALATSSMRLRVYKTCNRPIRSFVISKISFTSSYNTVLTLDYM